MEIHTKILIGLIVDVIRSVFAVTAYHYYTLMIQRTYTKLHDISWFKCLMNLCYLITSREWRIFSCEYPFNQIKNLYLKHVSFQVSYRIFWNRQNGQKHAQLAMSATRFFSNNSRHLVIIDIHAAAIVVKLTFQQNLHEKYFALGISNTPFLFFFHPNR